MSMKMKTFVIFVKPYSFTEKETGEIKEGVTVRYLITDSIKPAEGKKNDKGVSTKGYELGKVSMPANALLNFTSVPAFYNAEMKVITKDDKFSLVPEGFEFDSLPSFDIAKENLFKK